MKARVKATGATVFVRPYDEKFDFICDMEGERGVLYNKEQLEFPKDEPDYWEKLHHQAAIAAMQGMLSNSDYIERFTAHTVDGISCVDSLTSYANDYATALVEKLKNEK